jgi:hypothetical protein
MPVALRHILALTALAAVGLGATPGAAMPVAQLPAGQAQALTVQWLPRGYPFNPCAPYAPPVRVIKRDDWGRAFATFEPASNFCRAARGEIYLLPPPAFIAVPPSGYDRYGYPVYRWLLVPAP